jgi:hypothetical protein
VPPQHPSSAVMVGPRAGRRPARARRGVGSPRTPSRMSPLPGAAEPGCHQLRCSCPWLSDGRSQITAWPAGQGRRAPGQPGPAALVWEMPRAPCCVH